MLNGNSTIVLLIVGLKIFSITVTFRRKSESLIIFELNYYYETKGDLKNATAVDTSKFVLKSWFS